MAELFGLVGHAVSVLLPPQQRRQQTCERQAWNDIKVICIKQGVDRVVTLLTALCHTGYAITPSSINFIGGRRWPHYPLAAWLLLLLNDSNSNVDPNIATQPHHQKGYRSDRRPAGAAKASAAASYCCCEVNIKSVNIMRSEDGQHRRRRHWNDVPASAPNASTNNSCCLCCSLTLVFCCCWWWWCGWLRAFSSRKRLLCVGEWAAGGQADKWATPVARFCIEGLICTRRYTQTQAPSNILNLDQLLLLTEQRKFNK